MVDRKSAVRLGAVIAGVEINEERILRDREYAHTFTRSTTMKRDFHAALVIANRLELLVHDAAPPVRFAVSDIVDGALRVPFSMSQAAEKALLRYVRFRIKESPIYEIEITAERDVVLWSFVYDTAARKSFLEMADSSLEPFRRAG